MTGGRGFVMKRDSLLGAFFRQLIRKRILSEGIQVRELEITKMSEPGGEAARLRCQKARIQKR